MAFEDLHGILDVVIFSSVYLRYKTLHDELQLKRLKKRKLMPKDQIFMLQRQLVPDIPA